MDGISGVAGWRWIFILEVCPQNYALLSLLILAQGLATIVVSIIAAIFMPESIAKAKFLTEEEKQFACEPSRSAYDLSWSYILIAPSATLPRRQPYHLPDGCRTGHPFASRRLGRQGGEFPN
jgi:hypothetical protein